jgi:hypothetical protein
MSDIMTGGLGTDSQITQGYGEVSAPVATLLLLGCTLDDVVTNVPGPTSELGRRQLLNIDLFWGDFFLTVSGTGSGDGIILRGGAEDTVETSSADIVRVGGGLA